MITKEQIQKARKWRSEHEEHVKSFIEEATTSFEPCSEDINHPYLWKAASWKWLDDQLTNPDYTAEQKWDALREMMDENIVLELIVNMNDAFGPGADAEEADSKEFLNGLVSAYLNKGHEGVINWVRIKRKYK